MGGYSGRDLPEAASENPQLDHKLLGYLAVPFSDGVDILANGYIASAEWDKRVPPPGQTKCHTSRKNIPFTAKSEDPKKDSRQEAVNRMVMSRPAERYCLCLEIKKEPILADTGRIHPEWIVEGLNGGTEIQLPAAANQVLDKKFITDGVFQNRCFEDYEGIGCPCCGQAIVESTDPQAPSLSQRTKVGAAVYGCPAAAEGLKPGLPFFMVSPCTTPVCLKAMQDRQERLNKSPTRTLYHACSRETANAIRQGGGKLRRGREGVAGGGIYLAHTCRECWWKSEDAPGETKGPGALIRWWKKKGTPGWQEDGIAILEIVVQMGKEHQGNRWPAVKTFRDLQSEPGGPYDSVVIDRGLTGFPVPPPPVKAISTVPDPDAEFPTGTMLATRIEDVTGVVQRHPGYEFVIYSWDQVLSICEVPLAQRDPLP